MLLSRSFLVMFSYRGHFDDISIQTNVFCCAGIFCSEIPAGDNMLRLYKNTVAAHCSEFIFTSTNLPLWFFSSLLSDHTHERYLFGGGLSSMLSLSKLYTEHVLLDFSSLNASFETNEVHMQQKQCSGGLSLYSEWKNRTVS